jgi:hypothetical protein
LFKCRFQQKLLRNTVSLSVLTIYLKSIEIFTKRQQLCHHDRYCYDIICFWSGLVRDKNVRPKPSFRRRCGSIGWRDGVAVASLTRHTKGLKRVKSYFYFFYFEAVRIVYRWRATPFLINVQSSGKDKYNERQMVVFRVSTHRVSRLQQSSFFESFTRLSPYADDVTTISIAGRMSTRRRPIYIYIRDGSLSRFYIIIIIITIIIIIIENFVNTRALCALRLLVYDELQLIIIEWHFFGVCFP